MLAKTNLLISLCHDFGKLSPYFQQKIRNNPLNKREIRLARHVASSGFIAFIAIQFLLQSQQQAVDQQVPLIPLDLLPTISSLVVLNHHSRILSSNFSELIPHEDLEDILVLVPLLSREFSVFFPELKKDIPKWAEECIKRAMEAFEEKKDLDALQDLIYELDEGLMEIYDHRYSVDLFFWVSFLHSALCDSDEWDAKYFINDTQKTLISIDEQRTVISAKATDNYLSRILSQSVRASKDLLGLRKYLYETISNQADSTKIGQIMTLTAPTGSGKTLALLRFSLGLREHYRQNSSRIPRIIYCLPFISIVDQVAEVIADVTGQENEIHNAVLTVDHHLAKAQWVSLNIDELGSYPSERFPIRDLVKLWRSDIILTTFVKFWQTAMGTEKRDLLSFNRIAFSIIILDEVQSIPVKYWKIISSFLKFLTTYLGCTVILATATQPLIVPQIPENELAWVLREKKSLYPPRYQIFFQPEPISLDNFLSNLPKRLHGFISGKKDIMIVFNTKRAARTAFDKFSQYLEINYLEDECYLSFLSGYVTPYERRNILGTLREKLDDRTDKPAVLFCTQVIEAGVDVSFDVVFRDFGPFDAIIQVAGRVNRHSRGDLGTLYVQPLKSKNGLLALQVYRDRILLETTTAILTDSRFSSDSGDISFPYVLAESQVTAACGHYYELLQQRKKTDFCLDYIQNFNYSSLKEEFKLIDDQDDLVFLYIPCNEEAKRVLEEILSTLDYSKKHPASINPEFYQNVLSVSERDLIALITRSNILTEVLRKPLREGKTEIIVRKAKADRLGGEDVLFYILDEIEEAYDHIGGLRMSPD